jgi:hypothetical protein
MPSVEASAAGSDGAERAEIAPGLLITQRSEVKILPSLLFSQVKALFCQGGAFV